MIRKKFGTKLISWALVVSMLWTPQMMVSAETVDGTNEVLPGETIEAETNRSTMDGEDFSNLTAAQLQEKEALQAMLQDLLQAKEGVDYVSREVFCFAKSKEAAENYALAYGGELKSFADGIAVILLADHSVEEAFTMASDLQNNLPAVYPNYYREFCAPFTYGNAGDYLDQWHHLNLNSRNAWDVGITGKGTKLAILDSGMADFEDFTVEFSDYAKASGTIIAPYDDTSTPHGEYIGYLIGAARNTKGGIGMAPDASIWNYKVGHEKATDADIIWAINAATEKGADIINLSLGSYSYTTSYKEALNNAYNHGVLVIAAAGDGATNAPFYPASFDHVISITATNSANQLIAKANRSDTIDFAAPGDSILARGSAGSRAYMTGSSASAALVSGELALLFEAARGGYISKLPAKTMNTADKKRVDAVENYMKSKATSIGKGAGKGILTVPKLLNLPAINKKGATPKITYTVSEDSPHVFVNISVPYGYRIVYTTDGSTPVYGATGSYLKGTYVEGNTVENIKVPMKYSSDSKYNIYKCNIKAIAVSVGGATSSVKTITPTIKTRKNPADLPSSSSKVKDYDFYIYGTSYICRGSSAQYTLCEFDTGWKMPPYKLYLLPGDAKLDYSDVIASIKAQDETAKLKKVGITLTQKGKLTVASTCPDEYLNKNYGIYLCATNGSTRYKSLVFRILPENKNTIQSLRFSKPTVELYYDNVHYSADDKQSDVVNLLDNNSALQLEAYDQNGKRVPLTQENASIVAVDVRYPLKTGMNAKNGYFYFEANSYGEGDVVAYTTDGGGATAKVHVKCYDFPAVSYTAKAKANANKYIVKGKSMTFSAKVTEKFYDKSNKLKYFLSTSDKCYDTVNYEILDESQILAAKGITVTDKGVVKIDKNAQSGTYYVWVTTQEMYKRGKYLNNCYQKLAFHVCDGVAKKFNIENYGVDSIDYVNTNLHYDNYVYRRGGAIGNYEAAIVYKITANGTGDWGKTVNAFTAVASDPSLVSLTIKDNLLEVSSTGKAAGKTTITLTSLDGKAKGKITVTVKDYAYRLRGEDLRGKNFYVVPGDKIQITPMITDDKGMRKLTSKEVEFYIKETTSDKVAYRDYYSVDSNGLVTISPTFPCSKTKSNIYLEIGLRMKDSSSWTSVTLKVQDPVTEINLSEPVFTNGILKFKDGSALSNADTGIFTVGTTTILKLEPENAYSLLYDTKIATVPDYKITVADPSIASVYLGTYESEQCLCIEAFKAGTTTFTVQTLESSGYSTTFTLITGP